MDKPAWLVFRGDTYFGHRSKSAAMDVAKDFSEAYPRSSFHVVAAMIEETIPIRADAPQRFTVNAFGEELKTLRQKDDVTMIIELVRPDKEIPEGSFKVTISDGQNQESGQSINLQDAIEQARLLLNVQAIKPVYATPALLEVASTFEKPKISAAGLSIKKKPVD